MREVAGAAVVNVPAVPSSLIAAYSDSLVWVDAPVYSPPMTSAFPAENTAVVAARACPSPVVGDQGVAMSRVLGLSLATYTVLCELLGPVSLGAIALPSPPTT